MSDVSDLRLITSAHETRVARFRRWGLIAVPLAHRKPTGTAPAKPAPSPAGQGQQP